MYAKLSEVGDDLDELKRKHGEAEGYKLIQKMVASCKTHCNILDMEASYLNEA